jgi:hypothetical protein
MNNEFYCVNIYWEPNHFFRSKDAAFAYLYQEYLKKYGYSYRILAEVKQELNESYRIEGFGSIQVCGFED